MFFFNKYREIPKHDRVIFFQFQQVLNLRNFTLAMNFMV